MFDTLSDRLERLSSSLRSRGRLSEADVDSALSEVRTALLEADVEVGVVRAFTAAGVPLVRDTLGAFERHRAAQIEILRHPNPQNRILHTGRSSDTANSLFERLGINDAAAVEFIRKSPLARSQLLGKAGRSVRAETDANPRARSAKLRFATRTAAPAQPLSDRLGRLARLPEHDKGKH